MAFRWISILFLLLLTAGCGSSFISDPNEIQKLDGNEKREIIFWHSYSDEETRLLEQELIPAFEREHPNIRVKPLHRANNNELRSTLIARSSSSRGPDVIRLDLSKVPEFVQKGFLQSLDQFPGFESIRNNFQSEALNIGFFKYNYYSIPLNIFTKAAIFNRKLLEQAGYSAPPSSLEEIFKIARGHQYTIGLGGFGAWHTLPYIYSLGGCLTNNTYSKASGYLNGEGTVHAVEKLLILYKEKILNFSVETGGIDNWAGVQSGNVIMTDEGPWFYNKMKETELSNAMKLTIPVPFPLGSGPGPIVGGEHLVILKGSKVPNEAWTFVKWMSGKDPQLIMSRTGLLPANLDSVKSLRVSPDSFVYPYLTVLNSTFRYPPVKNWNQIDEVYTLYLHEIFSGEVSVKDGLDRAAAEIDGLL